MLIFVKTLKRVLIAFLLIFTEILLAACGVTTPVPTATTTTIPTSTPTYTPTASQELDTPSLIAQAYGRGEINKEERLLYLAYAVYEPKSLPAQYRSKVGWFGESVDEELIEVVNSPLKLCFMSPHARRELLRLFDSDTICN